MKKLHKKNGFTLIEMLIVIAIIGILASIVLIGLGPVQRKGRDSRRISDLKSVQTGLELYYNQKSVYPAAPNGWQDVQTALAGPGAGLGISIIPDDPSSGGSSPKHYDYCTDGTSYVISAQLEDPTNPAMKDSLTDKGIPQNCQPAISGCGLAGLYCVSL